MVRQALAYGLVLGTIAWVLTGCGYRVATRGGALPSEIQSVGIPTLINRTPQHAIEQRLTQALIREFTERTKLSVSSSSHNVDALLEGEIIGVGAAPVGFSKEKFGAIYLITISLKVKLNNLKNNKVIFQNDNFVFRDEYVINPNATQFFSEENLSIERMAKDFAASLLASVFEKF